MQTIRIAKFLRGVLLVDAATCLAMGLLFIFFSARLSDYLALPTPLLFYPGLSLVPFAGFLVYLATRSRTVSPLVWVVVIGNALWTLDSILILLTGWITPNTFGLFFVVFQAVGVAILAGLELVGLKRSEVQSGPVLQQS